MPPLWAQPPGTVFGALPSDPSSLLLKPFTSDWDSNPQVKTHSNEAQVLDVSLQEESSERQRDR